MLFALVATLICLAAASVLVVWMCITATKEIDSLQERLRAAYDAKEALSYEAESGSRTIANQRLMIQELFDTIRTGESYGGLMREWSFHLMDYQDAMRGHCGEGPEPTRPSFHEYMLEAFRESPEEANEVFFPIQRSHLYV
jgi:hypothetical protein